MLLEHFDKCSDLKNFTDKNITDKDLDGVSSKDIDKCSKLDILLNEHNKDSQLYNTRLTSNIDNKAYTTSSMIYVFIIIAFIVNIYLGLFITPFLLAGSALISVFIILLSLLILFLLIFLFS